MSALTTVLRYEIRVFLIALVVVIAYQLLTGSINTRGLLRDKMGDRTFSPGRLQLLMFSVGAALYYLLLVLENPNPGEFPEFPKGLLMALGGSHAFYLGGKLQSLLKQMFGLSSPQEK